MASKDEILLKLLRQQGPVDENLGICRLIYHYSWDFIRRERGCWAASLRAATGERRSSKRAAQLRNKLKCVTLGNKKRPIAIDLGLRLRLINSLTVAQEMTHLHTISLIKGRVKIIDQSPRVLALLSLGRTVIYTIALWNVITLPHCVTTGKISIVKAQTHASVCWSANVC